MKPSIDQAALVPRLADWLWLAAWGIASSVWCVTAAQQLGATFDEPFYIAGGLEYWRTGSHLSLLRKGTMPLAVDVCTLPLYVWERWRGVPFDPLADLDWLLPWARAATLVFWWLLLVYGRRVGRQLAGPWGGRLAVALLACEPSLLAHASLATTDLAVSACLLALAYHFHVARDADWSRRVAIPALWFAASVLTKASGLVCGPLILFAVEIERVRSSSSLRAALEPLRRDIVGIVGWGLVLVFLYCGSDWRPEPSFVAWAHSLPDGALGRGMVWVAEHLCIFSNAGHGLVRQIRHNIQGHRFGAYLLGQVRPSFWYYFPVALSIKLSPPLLAIPLVLLPIAPRALRNWPNIAALALLALSLTTRVQIGVRLVLPLVVFAAMGVAVSVCQAQRQYAAQSIRWALAGGVVLSVVWTATSAAAVWPNALSYVNALWGGTRRGYLLLSDSNYDWGQGLRELAQWQRQHDGERLDVWYFGTDPAVDVPPLRSLPLHLLPLASDADVAARLRGHRVAASTTLLYGTLMNDAQRVASTFLRARTPMARTTTFFMYDFTDADGTSANDRGSHDSNG